MANRPPAIVGLYVGHISTSVLHTSFSRFVSLSVTSIQSKWPFHVNPPTWWKKIFVCECFLNYFYFNNTFASIGLYLKVSVAIVTVVKIFGIDDIDNGHQHAGRWLLNASQQRFHPADDGFAMSIQEYENVSAGQPRTSQSGTNQTQPKWKKQISKC